MIKSYLKEYSNANPERFNDDFLNIKVNDNEVRYLETAMKTLNSIEGITYLRMEQIPHRIYKDQNEEEIVENNTIISIDQSSLKVYRFYFEISKQERTEEFSIELFYPEFVKGQYFLINNNRYFPVFQLLDSGFFNTTNAVVLKTLIMPLVMELKKDDTLSLNIFKKKMSPFFYFLAKFGYEDTLKYFNMYDHTTLVDNKKDLEQLGSDWECIEVNKKLFLCFEKDYYNNNLLLCKSLRECFNTRVKLDKVFEEDYWKKRLGTLFSTAPDKVKKANLTLVSFERALDSLNQELLRLDDNDKCDIYALIRYMMVNYDHLKTRDNCNLANKRVRSHEYLIYPLLRRFTNFVRRINNGRNITFEKLCDFKPTKGFLIKCMITNELLRYDNSCNSINIISKLKLSQGGAQSQFSGGAVNIIYRTNHPTYVGKIGLLATSAGDPGCTGTFTPFCKLIDGVHFTEKEE